MNFHSRPLCALALAAAFVGIAAAQSPSAATPGASAPAPVSVMIVGGYHMSNPGRDLHNVVSGDVLESAPQAELARIAEALNEFHPTAVMAEWDANVASERYAQFLAGTLPPSRNEVVQLGFRLAKRAGLKSFYGIDVEGDFPFEPVQTLAKARGQMKLIDDAGAEVEAHVRRLSAMIAKDGIAAALRYMNDPELISRDNGFYRQMLRVGQGAQQPGVDLLTAWYRRNFLICANLIQNTRPGDHVVVFYGSGHSFLLRQCVAETPGFQLVEPNAYLPK
jgi:hypothetical protein